MGLQFQPKSEGEIRTSNLAPEGEYDFEVLSAGDTTSKKGNPMISIKIGLYDSDRVRWHVYDYLLVQMEAKLRHFCDTTGLLARYESGQLKAEDCVGRSGRCRVKIKKDDQYPENNVIDDYVVRKAKPLAAEVPPKTGPDEDSDIPF